jgi:hypothetical protein
MTLQELDGLKKGDFIICVMSLSGTKKDAFISYDRYLKEVKMFDLTHKNELTFEQVFFIDNFNIA